MIINRNFQLKACNQSIRKAPKQFRYPIWLLISLLMVLDIMIAKAEDPTQKRKSDSLHAALLHSRRDIDKLRAATGLAMLFRDLPQKKDSAIFFARMAISLKKSTGWQPEHADAHYAIAHVYTMDKSEMEHDNLDSGFWISKKINYNRGIYRYYIYKSEAYRRKNNVSTTVSPLFEGERFILGRLSSGLNGSEKTEALTDLATTYNKIGTLLVDYQNLSDGFKYQFKSYKIWVQIDPDHTGGILSDLGNIWYLQNNFDSALVYYEKAYRVNVRIKDYYGCGYSLCNIGMAYFKKNELKKALPYFFKARENYRIAENIDGEVFALSNMGASEMDLNMLDSGIKHAQDIIRLNKIRKVDLRNAYNILSYCYEHQGKFKESIFYTNKLKDTFYYLYRRQVEVSRNSLTTKMAVLEKENELYRYKAEKEKSTLENRILVSIFTAIVIILLISAFFYFRLRQVRNLLKLKTKISSDLHDEVGGLLTRIAIHSEVLESNPDNHNLVMETLPKIRHASQRAVTSMGDLIWSIDERNGHFRDLVDRMQEGAAEMLDSKSIGYDLQVIGLDLNSRLDSNVRQNVLYIFKESLNNTVKHSDANFVNIRLSSWGKGFEMSISDNGSIPPNPLKKTGHGLRNMEMRAKFIHAILEIKTGRGYEVVLRKS